MAKTEIKAGLKFKEKNNFSQKHEVISVDRKLNMVFIKTTSEDQLGEKKNWRLDDVQFFLDNGAYEIVNERPLVTKHDQLEDCGSHSD